MSRPQERPHRLRPGSRAGIIFAITAALHELPEEDHAKLLTWVAERGLLGVARRQGLRIASGVAYELADSLGGAR